MNITEPFEAGIVPASALLQLYKAGFKWLHAGFNIEQAAVYKFKLYQETPNFGWGSRGDMDIKSSTWCREYCMMRWMEGKDGMDKSMKEEVLKGLDSKTSKHTH